MKIFALKFVLFLVLVLVLLKILDQYYTTYSVKHKNLCEKPYWIMNHSNQAIDLAFIGNSRVYNMIDVNLIEKITGKVGINLGLTGSNYAENYLILDQFFKSGNKVKNLVIQVDMNSLNSNTFSYPFHSFFYMHLLNDTTVSNIFKDCTPQYRFLMWKYIPFIRYMEFNNRFVLYKILKGGFECATSSEFDSTKGSVLFSSDTFKSENSKYTYRIVNKMDVKYLQKIIALAKQKKTTVVLYTAPIYNKCFHYQLNYSEILTTAKNIADSNNIRFFDFNETSNPLCMDQNNFTDDVHMNTVGVRKFNPILLDSIKTLLLK